MDQNQNSRVKNTIAAKYCPESQTLDLTRCGEWIDVMLSRDWKNLNKLALSFNTLEDEGLQFVLQKLSNKIQHLYLIKCEITGSGIKKMLNYDLRALVSLQLSQNVIGSLGVKWIAKLQMLNLNFFCFNNCYIGEEGAKSLVKAKYPQLYTLQINQNNIKLNGSEKIRQNQWYQLKFLSINDSEKICIFQNVLSKTLNFRTVTQSLIRFKNNEFKLALFAAIKNKIL